MILLSRRAPLSSQAGGPDRGRALRWALVGLWILAGFQLLNMAVHPYLHTFAEGLWQPNHWDFDVYRAAHDAYRAGENPLDLAALAKRGQGIPYNYSPAFAKATMWLFDGPRDAVEVRFVLAKLVAIVLGFFTLVRGLGLKGAMVPVAAFLVAFGFGSGLLVDMAAGNITAFESLWMSLLVVGAYRRWDGLFLLGLFLLCFGKPIWGIFAAVPVLFWWDRRGWRAFAFGVGAFALPLVLSLLVSRAGTAQYLRASFGFREVGWINPCLRELLSGAMGTIGMGGKSATLAWVGIAGGLASWAARTRRSLGATPAGLAFGASSLLLLPCILPRFKPYAYGLLVPYLLLWMVVARPDARRTGRVLLFSSAPFLVTVTGPFIFAFVSYGYGLLHLAGYFPLFLVLATFGEMNRDRIRSAARGFASVLREQHLARAALVLAAGTVVLTTFVKQGEFTRKTTTDIAIRASTDLKTYTRAARLTAGGAVPYRDFTIEYPPTAAYYMAAPTRDPNVSAQGYFRGFVRMTYGLLVVLMLAFLAAATRVVGVVRASAFTIGTCFLLAICHELTFVRFDAPVALMATLGLMALLYRARAMGTLRLLGGGLLGIATGLKLFPVLPLAAVLRGMKGRERLAAAAGAGIGLLPTALLAAAGPQGVKSFLAYHSQRHIELGSVWSSLARRLFPWRMQIGYGSAECRFAAEGTFLGLASVATLVAAVVPLLWLRRATTPMQCLRIGIVALYGFVFFNKVGSPQYALWLLGATLAGIGDRPRRVWATMAGTALGVLGASDSISSFDVIHYTDRAAVFVDLKNVALFMGYLTAVWAMRDALRETSDERMPNEEPRVSSTLVASS